jgi:hypothetical protein
MSTAGNNSNYNNNKKELPVLSTSGRELLLDLRRSSQQYSGGSNNGSGGGGNGGRLTIPVLPQYNTVLVQKVHYDINMCVTRLYDASHVAQNHPDTYLGDDGKLVWEMRPYVTLLQNTVDRLKRCLMAYHKHRLQTIKTIVRLGGIDNNGNLIVDYGDRTSATAAATSEPASAVDDGGDETGVTGTTAITTVGPPISTNKAEVEFAIQYQELRDHHAIVNEQLPYLYRPPVPTSGNQMIQVRVVQDDVVGSGSGQADRKVVVLPDSGRILTLERGSIHYLKQADVQDLLWDGVLEPLENGREELA